MKKTRTTVPPTTRTTTVARALGQAAAAGRVEPLLEQFMRMRHGIGIDVDSPLQFRGQDHPETRVRLAMMEYELLQRYRKATTPAPLAARKARIIDRLREE